MPQLSSRIVNKLRKTAERFITPRGWELSKDNPRVGGSSAVFQVLAGTSLKALKIYSPAFFKGEDSPSEKRRVELQKKALGLDCDSLIRIESIELFQDTCISLMEYFPWAELKDQLARIPIECVQSIVDQLVVAVKTLASVGLIHRDIKPENILISPDHQRIKLVDLGVIREISISEDSVDATDRGLQRPFLATAQYSPPEYLFRTLEPSDELWKALNLYQIGAVIHDLITRRAIFADEMLTENRYRVALAVLTKRPVFTAQERENFPRLTLLSERCLVKDPSLRIALVNLDEFQQNSSLDPIAALNQELEKLTEVENSGSRSRQRLQLDQHKLKVMIDEVGNGVFDKLNALFGKGLKLVRVTAEETDYKRIFEIGFPHNTNSCRVILSSDSYDQEIPPEIPIFLLGTKNHTPAPLGSMTLQTAHDSTSIIQRAAEEIAVLLRAHLHELKNS